MVTDTIADLLTRIRNASAVRKKIVEVPASRIKLGIIEVLYKTGFIDKYKLVEQKPFNVIKVALKYSDFKEAAISNLTRISRPGLRKYIPVEEIPRVQNGLGICIMSTSKGIVTGQEAKELNVGGELLCTVY